MGDGQGQLDVTLLDFGTWSLACGQASKNGSIHVG